ncbi:MAG TPA: hypothetical protein PLY72_25210, partial [Candidatus Obscuribacter sp.]|nr:hypothetical protein [Candidatus Obscuribacter sp.]
KQKRIEAAAESPVPPRRYHKSEQKWRGASSSSNYENAGTVAAFLGKLKDFCARVSSLCHRRVD